MTKRPSTRLRQYVRVYDERTGNPTVDNRNRAKNRALNHVCQRAFRVDVGKSGRRRKKYVTSMEYPRYARIVATIADERMKQDGVL